MPRFDARRRDGSTAEPQSERTHERGIASDAASQTRHDRSRRRKTAGRPVRYSVHNVLDDIGATS